jgi:pimeloyl-ACP methyl ester carboxylesterase
MKKILLMLLFAAMSSVVLISCTKDDDDVTPVVKTYVLVHGAWQAPYVWDAVKASLQKQGAQVLVVELPGHGADQTAPLTLTVDVYRDKVVDAISKVNGKVILVGHSLGGIVISEVAEKIPAKIEKLVYIGAYLPVSGQSLLDLANTDADSYLAKPGNLIPSADQLTLAINHDQLANIFIQDGSEAIKAQVIQNYRAEPAIPFTNKITLTAANYGSVDKVYVKTLQDHVISPALQARMLGATPIKTTYQLNTSHSPFLSKPDSVAILLTKAGQ